MASRDRRSSDYPEPPTRPDDAAREVTQPLELTTDEPPPAAAPGPVPLAQGTHDHEATRVESPNARGKPGPAEPVPLPGMPRRKSDAPDPYLGAVLGSYRVIELLGKGGMGHVYRAEHVKLGREVALKLLRSDFASRREAVARFFQEARTVNRMRHRNIVEVTDFVELEDGTTYIIMELLAGQSLGAWARGGVEAARALAVVIQICEGLAAAHQVAVVHRDLKPDNVTIIAQPDGTDLVKLLDFGVAKLLDRPDEDLEHHTAVGSVIGTPAYMSPEQAGGMVIDARSDIYSLGAIMYELFCGQPLFRGRSFGDYVRLHLTEVPVAPRHTPGGAYIDPRLESVILRCLEKDPEQRFASIVELRDALIALHGALHAALHGFIGTAAAPWPQAHPSGLQSGPHSGLQSGPHTAHPSGLPAGPHSGLQSGPHAGPTGVQSGMYAGPHPGGGPGEASRSRAPWWTWLIAAIAAVAVGAAAAFWYGGTRAREASTPVPPAAAAEPAPARVQPATEPPPRPVPVEVHLESTPSGAVFAAGQPVELCRTPCALQIDPADGGPVDRRVYIVKRDGYRDAAIAIDLAGAQRDFRVELQPLAAPAAPSVERKVDPKPDRRGKRRDRSPEPRERKPGPPGAEPPAEPPATAPSAPKPPVPAIDPADTLDPFRKK